MLRMTGGDWAQRIGCMETRAILAPVPGRNAVSALLAFLIVEMKKVILMEAD